MLKDSNNMIAYWNGEFLPIQKIKISPFDRAYLFGDAIYEVILVSGKTPFLLNEHINRLNDNLATLSINYKIDWNKIVSECIQHNEVDEGIVYIQVSRGEGSRNHSFRHANYQPNCLIYSLNQKRPYQNILTSGLKIITLAETRSSLISIKTTNLLPNCLTRVKAEDTMAHDAIFIKESYITEATSSNVFIVKNRQIKTPPCDGNILPGITRSHLIYLLKKEKITVEETKISELELLSCDEAFLTSTTMGVVPVGEINKQPISIGPIFSKCRFLLEKAINPTAEYK